MPCRGCILMMFITQYPPLIGWISYGITNWTYSDPDTSVSHAQIQRAIFLEKKRTPAATQSDEWGFQKYGGNFSGKRSARGNIVRRVGLPKIHGESRNISCIQESIVNPRIRRESRNPSQIPKIHREPRNPSRIQESIVNLKIYCESSHPS